MQLLMQLLRLPLSKLKDNGTHGRSKSRLVSMLTQQLLKLPALVLKKNRLISLKFSRKSRGLLTRDGKMQRTKSSLTI